MDWNKFVKVYNIDIGGIEVRKEVSRADIIQTLLNEDEVAYKGSDGTFMLNPVVNDDESKDTVDFILKKIVRIQELKKNKEIVKEQDFVPITKKELAVKKPTSPKKSKNKTPKKCRKDNKEVSE